MPLSDAGKCLFTQVHRICLAGGATLLPYTSCSCCEARSLPFDLKARLGVSKENLYVVLHNPPSFSPTGSGITCAALVSSPTCLATASENLQRPWTIARLYNLVLAVRLKAYFKEHEHQMSQHATLDALTEAWTIAHFDKAVVCKVFGCVPALGTGRHLIGTCRQISGTCRHCCTGACRKL